MAEKVYIGTKRMVVETDDITSLSNHVCEDLDIGDLVIIVGNNGRKEKTYLVNENYGNKISLTSNTLNEVEVIEYVKSNEWQYFVKNTKEIGNLVRSNLPVINISIIQGTTGYEIFLGKSCFNLDKSEFYGDLDAKAQLIAQRLGIELPTIVDATTANEAFAIVVPAVNQLGEEAMLALIFEIILGYTTEFANMQFGSIQLGADAVALFHDNNSENIAFLHGGQWCGFNDIEGVLAIKNGATIDTIRIISE